MVQPRIQPLKPGRAVLGFTPAFFTKLAPNLALWGFAGVGAIAVIASGIPRFQRDVLDMVPGVRSYYVDDTPDSDKVRLPLAALVPFERTT
ncbi:hypothetical protein JCM8208_006455 [Rhodotorula glutinis]